MTEEQIKYMVNRFLSWQLPDDFNPDAGIKYTPIGNNKPTGTNLFDTNQATEMVRYIYYRDCFNVLFVCHS